MELNESQNANLELWVRLPPGQHRFSADIGQGSTLELSVDIASPAPLSEALELSAALEAVDRKGPYKQVRQSLERAENWLQKGATDKALQELLKATEPLQEQSADEARELRRAIDWQIWHAARALVGG